MGWLVHRIRFSTKPIIKNKLLTMEKQFFGLKPLNYVILNKNMFNRISNRSQETLVAYFFLTPWIIGFGLFILGAMLVSFLISLYKTNFSNVFEFVGFENYISLFGDPLTYKSLAVTAYYTFISTPLQTILALCIALLLNQKIKFIGIFRTIYYLPTVVSGVAVILLWWWIFHPDLGLLNSFLSKLDVSPLPRWLYSEEYAMPAIIIMSLWLNGAGANMLIFLGALKEIPQTYYEAASIDGANAWSKFIHVTLPMISPAILFNLIINLIGSFQVFNASYIMSLNGEGGPNNATLTFVLYLYRKAFIQLQFGYASALAWVLFFIILIFTVFIMKKSSAWVYYHSEGRI